MRQKPRTAGKLVVAGKPQAWVGEPSPLSHAQALCIPALSTELRGLSRSEKSLKGGQFILQENTQIKKKSEEKFRGFTWEITPRRSSERVRPPTAYRQDTMSKRSASPPPAQGTLIKRSRSSEPQNTSQLIISSSGKEREQALIRTVKRTSNLEAPIVSLSGAHGVSFCSFENAVVLAVNRCGREKF
jgi:hypothetical protein